MSRGALKESGDLRWRHGHTRRRDGRVVSPSYISWTNMLTRCTNERDEHFRHYGARGIQVCERWKDFQNFLADMGERPAGASLDRINNDGNYEPSNCRWATKQEQARNRRSTRPVVRSDGKRYPSLAVAADDVGGNINGVWSACSGKIKTHRGYGWRYAV